MRKFEGEIDRLNCQNHVLKSWTVTANHREQRSQEHANTTGSTAHCEILDLSNDWQLATVVCLELSKSSKRCQVCQSLFKSVQSCGQHGIWARPTLPQGGLQNKHDTSEPCRYQWCYRSTRFNAALWDAWTSFIASHLLHALERKSDSARQNFPVHPWNVSHVAAFSVYGPPPWTIILHMQYKTDTSNFITNILRGGDDQSSGQPHTGPRKVTLRCFFAAKMSQKWHIMDAVERHVEYSAWLSFKLLSTCPHWVFFRCRYVFRHQSRVASRVSVWILTRTRVHFYVHPEFSVNGLCFVCGSEQHRQKRIFATALSSFSSFDNCPQKTPVKSCPPSRKQTSD